MAAPTPAGLALALVCLTSLVACLPSASVEAPVAEPVAEPEAKPSPPRHALVHGPIRVYADPNLDAQHLVLEPAAQASGDRALELLEADANQAWWRVRTLLPRQALALGLEAEAGIAVLSLEGWVEAGQLSMIEGTHRRAPNQTAAATLTHPEVPADARVPTTHNVRAGTVLRWPDGRRADEAAEDHFFYTPPTYRDSGGHDVPTRLACHELRTGPGVGVVRGWLCEDQADAAAAESVDPSVAAALDGPPSWREVSDSPEAPKGALDRDVIRQIVRANIDAVRDCYNLGLAQDPQLAGRVSINFVITPDGSVGSAMVQESTLTDNTVADCIAAAAQTWTFPKPRGGGNVVVTYPFNLAPG